MSALLMVKDFDESHKFEILNKLMSNADLSAIVCLSLDRGCSTKEMDPTKTNNDRSMVLKAIFYAKLSRLNKFFGTDAYEIKGSIFDLENYKKID
ncbi:hypothetical protein CDQ74_02810 [Campylobacter hyointestinalis subsp. hyointestinalis]|uniref:Uncharacterized protein n=1 Tax=Campylobacter hyointestinalis subsp. hyointestinalis TaxID=91352 RepID=A0A855NEQ4_CAMHY|nr:hypothetical protein CHH_0061 [Campylobacter hyointestinalis subsp. hyointestinalis LMG 9260]KEA44087.1 hypothetical protein CR67_06550 [Campylobacter hyointestinalis subsp. hyointestinalis]SFT60093.1 hypothetical protein SAMN05421691_1392 [Campylobacter hyointestinalis]PPB57181.1 hypothetical protein CDQ70_07825 [Campylobacter hyointestinalis subsp. hyointestinalis]PPB64405.1 hypothetical protein CDQ74_02810 [Campylobacter hyointestinalis subsp. hyointestinalis]